MSRLRSTMGRCFEGPKVKNRRAKGENREFSLAIPFVTRNIAPRSNLANWSFWIEYSGCRFDCGIASQSTSFNFAVPRLVGEKPRSLSIIPQFPSRSDSRRVKPNGKSCSFILRSVRPCAHALGERGQWACFRFLDWIRHIGYGAKTL